jgi:hypothetical protein
VREVLERGERIEEYPVVITTYEPDPKEGEPDLKTRSRS